MPEEIQYETLADNQKQVVLVRLADNEGRLGATAASLGISVRTLRRWLRQWTLEAERRLREQSSLADKTPPDLPG